MTQVTLEILGLYDRAKKLLFGQITGPLFTESIISGLLPEELIQKVRNRATFDLAVVKDLDKSAVRNTIRAALIGEVFSVYAFFDPDGGLLEEDEITAIRVILSAVIETAQQESTLDFMSPIEQLSPNIKRWLVTYDELAQKSYEDPHVGLRKNNTIAKLAPRHFGLAVNYLNRWLQS